MLELIAMIAGLVVCVMMPIEMTRIRKGWVHKKFAGDRPKFLAALPQAGQGADVARPLLRCDGDRLGGA